MCNMKAAQGLIEYILVFLFATVVLYFFASKIDLSKLKGFAVYGVKKQGSVNKIILPAMTE